MNCIPYELSKRMKIKKYVQMIYIIFGIPMILMVAVGYKTKLVSITLIVALFIHNMRYNNFWRHRKDLFMTDSVHTDPFDLPRSFNGSN